MSALTEREKAARLRTVMAAAKHVLAEDARVGDRPKEFVSGSIFPDGADRHVHSNAEYSWRQQLAWGWAKAGYMRVDVAGKGLQKHYAYTLTNEGREALAHIASDPVMASFYVPRKRAYNAGDHDQAWYQPPELRVEDEGVRGVRVEDDTDEDDEGDEPEEAPEPAPADPAATTLAVFFDRSIAVLERMDSRLEAFDARMARLEAEVKTQSDLVLSVAGRAESGATTADVNAAARQLTGALGQIKMLDPGVPEIRREVSMVNEALDTLHADVAKLVEVVGGLARRPVSAPIAATLPAAALPEDVLASLRGLGGLRATVDEIHKKMQAPIEMRVLDEDENLTAIAAAIDRLGPMVSKLLTQIGTAEDTYLKTLELRRKDLATLNVTMNDLAEAANTVIDGAKFVAGELISRSLDKSVAEGTPASVAHQQQAHALETFAAAKNANRNRSTALGGALIRLDSFTHTGKIDPFIPPQAASDTERK